MPRLHVFAETNWLVGCFAPAHLKSPEALTLLKSAKPGTIDIHVPSICLTEARTTIRRKFQPRSHLAPIRNYLRWVSTDVLSDPTKETIRKALDGYQTSVQAELDGLEITLQTFAQTPGIDVFALSEPMLERSRSLGFEKLELQPFDNSILAAIITRAEALKKNEPDSQLVLCQLDDDLRPWNSEGQVKPTLARLYDDARVWVYGDFEMAKPPRPENWKYK
jgi:predicted transcriptional regulator with HTH domain